MLPWKNALGVVLGNQEAHSELETMMAAVIVPFSIGLVLIVWVGIALLRERIRERRREVPEIVEYVIPRRRYD